MKNSERALKMKPFTHRTRDPAALYRENLLQSCISLLVLGKFRAVPFQLPEGCNVDGNPLDLLHGTLGQNGLRVFLVGQNDKPKSAGPGALLLCVLAFDVAVRYKYRFNGAKAFPM